MLTVIQVIMFVLGKAIKIGYVDNKKRRVTMWRQIHQNMKSNFYWMIIKYLFAINN